MWWPQVDKDMRIICVQRKENTSEQQGQIFPANLHVKLFLIRLWGEGTVRHEDRPLRSTHRRRFQPRLPWFLFHIMFEVKFHFEPSYLWVSSGALISASYDFYFSETQETPKSEMLFPACRIQTALGWRRRCIPMETGRLLSLLQLMWGVEEMWASENQHLGENVLVCLFVCFWPNPLSHTALIIRPHLRYVTNKSWHVTVRRRTTFVWDQVTTIVNMYLSVYLVYLTSTSIYLMFKMYNTTMFILL